MSFLSAYRERIADGRLVEDAGHTEALAALNTLEDALNTMAEPGFSLPFTKSDNKAPPGVYLWGPVGRGKSTLMDLFFQNAPVEKKRRVHFHEFMQKDVHARINRWRRAGPAERKIIFGPVKGNDPIPALASKIYDDAHLLCFDEFQIEDIADAMILGRLFEALFAEGMTVVATSNRHPSELYKDGLNRQHIVPFLETLEEKLTVVSVDGDVDHRLKGLTGAAYFAPLEPEAEAAFERAWQKATDAEAVRPRDLDMPGRSLHVPEAAGRVARMSFKDACEAPLGPADYLKLAETFDALFVRDVPKMGPDKRNAAKRLVALVDAFYEAKKRLVFLADAEPFGLYTLGDGAFEFQRTASRLHEMRSPTWGQADAPAGL